jgi:uncharacterized protein (DUF1919 family)
MREVNRQARRYLREVYPCGTQIQMQILTIHTMVSEEVAIDRRPEWETRLLRIKQTTSLTVAMMKSFGKEHQ